MAPKYSAALAAEFPAFDPELAPDAEDADIDHSEQEELEMPAPHLPEASDPDGLLRAARPGGDHEAAQLFLQIYECFYKFSRIWQSQTRLLPLPLRLLLIVVSVFFVYSGSWTRHQTVPGVRIVLVCNIAYEHERRSSSGSTRRRRVGRCCAISFFPRRTTQECI